LGDLKKFSEKKADLAAVAQSVEWKKTAAMTC